MHSQTWPAPQQAHLHAALSRAYMAVRDYEHWGSEAILAVQLDPGSTALVAAVRYLAWKNRPAEAAKLLASAPLPKSAALEAERIRVAAALLPGTEAKDELLRAQRAGLDIDRYTAARALEHVGDAAGANALLNADPSSRQHESSQNRQFRLDVAFDANDAKTAADIIQAQYADNRNAAQLMPAYAHLVGLAPSYLGRGSLVPIAVCLVVFLLVLAATPGLLMFPAHYRGTVRRRIGKPCTPLFERIGLRHAWLALAILMAVLYVVGMVRFGGARSFSSGGGGVVRVDWQQRVAVTHVWALAFGALGLIGIGRLLSWREWLGSGQWKASWALRPAVLLACNVVGTYLLSLQANAHAHVNWTNVPWAVALVHGAESLGGPPLALLILSVLVPVMEELVFRGAMLGGLSRHLSFGWANVLQALTFAGMHQDSRHYVYLFLFGVIAGWLARQTRGLAMPIVFHAVNNAIFVFWVTAW
ncbi:MAG: CPBP family intramembrane glutamic endopeptidase [Burkholderia sp.]